MTRPIRIRIDELVLHGFEAHDRHAIGDAIRAELATAFEGDTLRDATERSVPYVRAGVVGVAEPQRAAAIGTAVADAVARAAGKGEGR